MRNSLRDGPKVCLVRTLAQLPTVEYAGLLSEFMGRVQTAELLERTCGSWIKISRSKQDFLSQLDKIISMLSHILMYVVAG